MKRIPWLQVIIKAKAKNGAWEGEAFLRLPDDPKEIADLLFAVDAASITAAFEKFGELPFMSLVINHHLLPVSETVHEQLLRVSAGHTEGLAGRIIWTPIKKNAPRRSVNGQG